MTSRIFKHLGIAYLACLLAFSLMLVGAFAIPSDLVRSNVESSTGLLESEGAYPRFMAPGPSWQVDNDATAAMLNIAVHGDGMGAYGAFSAFAYTSPLHGADRIASLKEGLQLPADPSNSAWSSHARSWNGWIVLLKPLLLVGDLATLRVIFLCALAVLVVALCALLARRMGLAAIAPPLALLAVNAPLAMMSPSLSFSIFIGLAACIALAVKEGGDQARGQSEGKRTWLAVLFFVVGALAAYTDLSRTPLLALGMPLTLHIALDRERTVGFGGLGHGLLGALSLCAAWGAGYALLWASKWLLSTLVCGWNVFENAEMAAAMLAGGTALGGTHAGLEAVWENLTTWLPPAGLVAVLAVWSLLLVLAIVRIARSRQQGHWAAFFVALAVCLIPFARFALLPGESWEHSWFAYRELAVTLQGALLALWVLVPKEARQWRPAHAPASGRSGSANSAALVPRNQAVSGRQRSQALRQAGSSDAYYDYEEYEDYGNYDEYEDYEE